jgi:hypothetical protein
MDVTLKLRLETVREIERISTVLTRNVSEGSATPTRVNRQQS